MAALIAGVPGERWTNDTGTVRYQLLVSWIHSCGVCVQYDHAVSTWWPIPFHRGCRCRQKAVWPGGTSLPFVDFREEVRKLDRHQQAHVIGASSLRLVESGVVAWSDVVTPGRVRSLREVVSRHQLGVEEMVRAGVMRRYAVAAHEAVHTPAHEIASAERQAAVAALNQLGLSTGQIVERAGRLIAGRVTLAGGAPPPAPPAAPKPPPYSTPHFEPPARVEKPGGRPPPPPMPVSTPNTTPPAPPTGFPPDPDALTVIKQLGGSTGAELVEDAWGRRWVRKSGANAGHLLEEGHADALYAAAGAPVPKSQVYQTAAGPVKLAEFVEGKSLGELYRSDPQAAAAAEKELRKHFVLDALLGNWDVIGMDADNVLVGTNGVVYRIDNGGALRYRAQGALKGALKTAAQFGATVGELNSLRNPALNPSAAQVFGKLTDQQVQAQARALLQRRAQVLAAAPAPLRAVLGKRFDDLARFAAAQAPAAARPTLPLKAYRKFTAEPAMDAWGDQHYRGWAAARSGEENQAVANYTATGYNWMNPALRTGSVAGLSPDERQQIRTLDQALRRAATPEPVTVYRGLQDAAASGIDLKSLKVGMVFTDLGFGSTSLKKTIGADFSTTGGAVLEIMVPAGAPAAYVNAAGYHSSTQSEKELLFAAGALKVKVIKVRQSAGKAPHIMVEWIP